MQGTLADNQPAHPVMQADPLLGLMTGVEHLQLYLRLKVLAF